MTIPLIKNISREEFEASEDIYKIIVHDYSVTFRSFLFNQRQYYISSISSEIIRVDVKLLQKEGYLLVGIDLRVVVLCAKSGRILLSIGLSSYFKGFEDIGPLNFKIFSELEDIVINKNGFSISQTIPHDLDF